LINEQTGETELSNNELNKWICYNRESEF